MAGTRPAMTDKGIQRRGFDRSRAPIVMAGLDPAIQATTVNTNERLAPRRAWNGYFGQGG